MKHLPHQGILFEYNNTGILLTGESGIGKSDIMLQLFQHKARLVCDDTPLFKAKA